MGIIYYREVRQVIGSRERGEREGGREREWKEKQKENIIVFCHKKEVLVQWKGRERKREEEETVEGVFFLFLSQGATNQVLCLVCCWRKN